MTENNSLRLSDKLVLVALELLIPKQKEQPIKRTHIANIAGVSPRTVTNSLKRLQQLGIVSVERPHTGTYYTYTLHKDKAPQVEESSLLALLL